MIDLLDEVLLGAGVLVLLLGGDLLLGAGLLAAGGVLHLFFHGGV